MKDSPLRCHAAVTGAEDAPPVVLLHSIATSGAMWSPQVPIWASRFRLINVDLPGHGLSAAPDGGTSCAELADMVCELLDAHGIESAGIVGLSLGGMIAQALALNHSDRVRSLVIAHASARIAPPARAVWRRRIAAVESLGMESQIEDTIARWFTPEFRLRAPLTVTWVEHLIRSTDPRGYCAAARAIEQLDDLDRLGSIHAPTLVVTGRHDPAAPPAACEAMAAALPSARLHVLECAHLGNVEQASEFTEIVGAFLAQTEP